MYILDCASELKPVMTLIGYIIEFIKIGIPIILIILGMIDLGKAVIASKEDEVKKARSAFLRRLLYAVLVFAVVWGVQLALNFVTSLFDGDEVSGTNDWRGCWSCIVSKGKENDSCNFVDLEDMNSDSESNEEGQ